MKLSVHSVKDGDPKSKFVCQFGLTREYRNKHLGSVHPVRNSHVFRWKRRQAAGQAHVVARLFFPTKYLTDSKPVPPISSKKEHEFYKPATAGNSILIQLIALPKSENKDAIWQAHEPANTVLQMPLGTAEQCVVTRQEVDITPDLPLDKSIKVPFESRSALIQSLEFGKVTKDLSGFFHSEPKDYGCIDITEMSGLPMIPRLNDGGLTEAM